ncbi:MAG: caspase family protein [Tardiphaga sp.]|uniref:caspase family protein n=1 Tax=Tardiphaga sp. TaxID=1926292 RepID=UPI0019B95BDE|nr:caspase family protein [Tardiphaga sp.]MBC7582387.1 caspase family protein [Tardiphaga sp.]
MRMRFPIAGLLAMLVLAATPALAADNAGRFALVIGNARYPDAEAPLKEPVNDARDVAAELKRSGFEVDIGENLGGEAMRRALDKLYGKLKPGSVALVFFSGFGVQSARQSYLLPVDAQIWTEPDVRRDGFSLETILNDINGRGAGVKIALLDASRRNPYERRFRSFSAGLAPVIAPGGTLVMYSAALSSVVSDAGTAHSLFVSELLKEIKSPDLTAEDALNRTRVNVTKASRSEQVPWISSSLAEDFAFVPGARPAPAPAIVAAPSPPVAVTPPAPATAAPAAPAAATPPSTPVAPAAEAPRDEAKIALALAEDPTVKSLNAKLVENPEDLSALYRRGQVYASKGAYQLAAKDFDETLRLNPKDVEALNNRCWVRAVLNELAAALKDCNEALRLRPNFVDALDSRGLVNLKNGQSKNAITDFDDALKINPRLTSSLYGRGLAKQRSGAVAEGDLDINNAKAMDPDIVKEFAGYGVR